MERARSFDGAAAAYDAHRSGYPPALFSDVAAIANLKAGARMLEVGCGSGQATAGFVGADVDVTGVDPGVSLVDLARAKFSDASGVRFEVASFEEWERNGRRFDLVAAAQSWHWVRADVGFAKAADALSPGGSIAIFGHTPAWSVDLLDRFRPFYSRSAPEISGPPPEVWYLPDGPVAGLVRASGRFGDVEHRGYAWRREYTAASFAGYLGTRSDHLLLPPERRAALLADVESALPASFEADWVTNLYVAPRLSEAGAMVRPT